MRFSSERSLLLLTFAAALAINLYPAFCPLLWGDDLEIILRSWSWDRTRATLWEPQNEHAMPLGRLSTRGLVLLAGRPTFLPLVTALQGPLAQLAAIALFYLFVRRELDDARLAVLAAALFGVTSLYHQAVSWFAASFSLLALETILLALLAAQRWRLTGRGRWLGSCALATALAPAWFASGILAGPLCSLYLLSARAKKNKGQYAIRCLQFAVPLLGTIAFLGVSLPHTATYIMHLEHYDGHSAAEAFGLRIGAWYTCRSLVDNLLLGQVGVSGVRCPQWLVALSLPLIGVAACWWCKRAPHRRLLILGLGFIVSSYLLVYTARAGWDYDDYNFASPTWSRYHLLPQLGLALLVVGGLAAGVPLDRRQFRLMCLMLAVLVVLHLPRVIAQHWFRSTQEQQAVLRLIERTDQRCGELGIDATTARGALGWLIVPEGSSKENGWDLLRGSDAPHRFSVEEARRLLADNDSQ